MVERLDHRLARAQAHPQVWGEKHLGVVVHPMPSGSGSGCRRRAMPGRSCRHRAQHWRVLVDEGASGDVAVTPGFIFAKSSVSNMPWVSGSRAATTT